jgi:uncharacterized protein YbcV (DUF1398 family)
MHARKRINTTSASFYNYTTFSSTDNGIKNVNKHKKTRSASYETIIQKASVAHQRRWFAFPKFCISSLSYFRKHNDLHHTYLDFALRYILPLRINFVKSL